MAFTHLYQQVATMWIFCCCFCIYLEESQTLNMLNEKVATCPESIGTAAVSGCWFHSL